MSKAKKVVIDDFEIDAPVQSVVRYGYPFGTVDYRTITPARCEELLAKGFPHIRKKEKQ